jgi:RND family efflux transporter MFP subunit
VRRHLAPCALLAFLAACTSQPPAEKGAAPARVANAVKETDFTSVTLSPQAEARLAIETGAVEEREVRQARVVGGEVVAPPGRGVIVAAPLAGTVLAPASGAVPTPGVRVARGQAILRLRPLPGAVDLAAAQERLEVARARARRAEQLLEAGATSERAVEDARAELAAAESTARALAPTADTGAGGLLVLASPDDGVMGAVRVAPGQSVAAATPLFDVVPRDQLWVRVPVYVGDLGAVDAAAGAVIRALGAPPGTRGRTARPVQGPPTADPLAATSDLFFAVANADGSLRPGERVEVELRLRQPEAVRVVPWSAVVYDVDGGTWVYEATAAHVFARRRVEVRRVDGSLAVLSGGPAPGTRVVSQGAAELFGTELGHGK